MPPTLEAAHARTLLAAYLARLGKTETLLAVECGVPQYTISKFLHGRIKSVTPGVQKLLDYANIGITENIGGLAADPRVLRALASAWDGTDQGTALLADAIHALAPLIRASRPK